AMACGCSVIGSRVGGVPELIADGVSGLLFDPGSEDQLAAHLETLLSQHGLRKQLAAEAARRATALSPDDPLAHARQAELELGLGRAQAGGDSARRALALAPDTPRAAALAAF
ncbi:MAG: glycosyltransferase, partial [Candidatus Hydrogenedentes bacterium]|nr:glycosyltransferase [Candidatus Hydrogenedentota bacterium]